MSIYLSIYLYCIYTPPLTRMRQISEKPCVAATMSGGKMPVCRLQSFLRCTYLASELMSLLLIACTSASAFQHNLLHFRHTRTG